MRVVLLLVPWLTYSPLLRPPLRPLAQAAFYSTCASRIVKPPFYSYVVYILGGSKCMQILHYDFQTIDQPNRLPAPLDSAMPSLEVHPFLLSACKAVSKHPSGANEGTDASFSNLLGHHVGLLCMGLSAKHFSTVAC